MRTAPSVLGALGLLLVLALLAGPVAVVGNAILAGPALAQDSPAPEPSAIAVIVVVVLAVAAGRGNGTTVVKA